jgi:hypothetical protein
MDDYKGIKDYSEIAFPNMYSISYTQNID